MGRKPIYDPGTRWLVEAPEEGPGIPRREGGAAPFVELCARSAFSGLAIEGAVEGPTCVHAEGAWPGAGLPEEIAERLCVFDCDAFSLTDVNTLAGMVRAHSRARELGLRLIVGSELLLTQGSLVLHAADLEGYQNLCFLLTEAKRDRPKGVVEHRLESICRRAAGLFATVLPPFESDAVEPLKEAFGARLSIGIYRHDTPEDEARTLWAQRLSARFDAPLLATARPFLVDAADKPFHDVLTCIRQGLLRRSAGQRVLPNASARLYSPDEMAQRFADLPEALRRTREVADACTFVLGELKYAFPADKIGAETPQERLVRMTRAGACRRYGVGAFDEVSDAVRAQLEHEFALIADLDVAPYFITVYEIVEIARERGILCQGRGSAANSAVCFCLGITSVDPVRMGLLFERFLSKERGEPPDIDVDFEHERREEVIQEIYRKWGRDHAAMVCNVIAFRGRSAVREVGKVFGLTETVCKKLSGLMWYSGLKELTPERLAQVGIFAHQALVEETLHFARLLQGHPRHLGIHVGGFVLTQAPIYQLAPTEPARMENRTVVPFDKDDVEALGLFKMDVLGLGMLTCIQKAFDLLDEHEGTRYELHTIPAEDPAVYDALCRADSLGVFQVESRAQMAALPRLKPRSFYDLVVQVAIIRPGPIQGGMVHPYLRRRNGEEPVSYPHPALRPILERTLGIPLFQEQVMRIAVEGAGYTGGEADQLRRDMAAWKKTGRLFAHKERLINGFKSFGVDHEFAERLFSQIKGFGEYGFPESHAASFAILVYASSWLKTHHPAVFAAALMNSAPMGFYTPAQIISDAQRHGVTVRALSVNHSFYDHILERDGAGQPLTLRLGMRLIKGLGEGEADRIAEARDAEGAFSHPREVFRRGQISLKGQRALAASGALDGLTTHRREAVFSSMHKALPLLAFGQDREAGALLQTPSSEDILEMDYAHTGVSTDDHPVLYLRPVLLQALGPKLRQRFMTAKEIQEAPHKTHIITAGLVTGRQRPGTADGTCFVTLEDETGMTNVVVWGRNFEAWRQTIVTSPFLIFEGIVEREGIVVHLIASRVESVRSRLEPFPYRSRDFH